MTPQLTLVVVVVLAVLVVVLLVSLAARHRENAGLRPYQAQERPATGMAEVDRLVRAGRKIEAIKVYRQLTGVGLKEAKDAVESGYYPSATPPPPPAADMSTVDAALRADRKIEAIKVYRELTGVGLKEAKDAVERRAAGLPPAPPAPRFAAGHDLSEVDRLAAQGNLIQAIALYRKLTGASLKEARYAVEARHRR